MATEGGTRCAARVLSAFRSTNLLDAVTVPGVKLMLEDGTEMRGEAFGAHRPVGGEVVFNRGMTGYAGTLTDPSES